jgi:hypothetical protein
MDKDKRVSATCPICHEGELRRTDGPPEWYVLPAATLGLPDDEKRVGARHAGGHQRLFALRVRRSVPASNYRCARRQWRSRSPRAAGDQGQVTTPTQQESTLRRLRSGPNDA